MENIYRQITHSKGKRFPFLSHLLSPFTREMFMEQVACSGQQDSQVSKVQNSTWKRNIEYPSAGVIEVIKGKGRLAGSPYRLLVSPGSQVTFHMQIQAIDLSPPVSSLSRLHLACFLCLLPSLASGARRICVPFLLFGVHGQDLGMWLRTQQDEEQHWRLLDHAAFPGKPGINWTQETTSTYCLADNKGLQT